MLKHGSVSSCYVTSHRALCSDIGFLLRSRYFGRDIYSALSGTNQQGANVPVGLIATDVGGTPDQHWSSQDALDKCKGDNPWQWDANFTDSVLWNAMVVPVLRTVHSGVIWCESTHFSSLNCSFHSHTSCQSRLCLLSRHPDEFTADQGENNAGNPRRYNCSFPAMINDWRTKWSIYTDGATDAEFPFGWAQLNSCGLADAYENPLFHPKHSGCGICAPECNASCLGTLHEWGDVPQGGNIDNGFPCLRHAQSNTLSLPRTFQAVIIDTPVASGSIHSPFKQPCGRRLARGALAMAYGMPELNAVNPVVESVTLSTDKIFVTVDGLGKPGTGMGTLTATIGVEAFEVLGICGNATAPACWHSAPIVSYNATSITLTNLPAAPTAVRFLWYLAPYGVTPARAPVYIGGLPPMPEGTPPLPSEFTNEQLPLGPFILPL